MASEGGAGLSADPTRIRTNGNSGAQAINLALHLGARRAILVGFDMQRGTGGALHWHADHEGGLHNPFDQTLAGWRENMKSVAADAGRLGLEIVNASRETALLCFPRRRLEECLKT